MTARESTLIVVAALLVLALVARTSQADPPDRIDLDAAVTALLAAAPTGERRQVGACDVIVPRGYPASGPEVRRAVAQCVEHGGFAPRASIDLTRWSTMTASARDGRSNGGIR